MANHSEPTANQLLAALPLAEWERWLPQLEWVTMARGQLLYESGVTQAHAYFPTTAIVSLLHVTHSGTSAEIAVAGNEGMVGVSLSVGAGFAPLRGVVRSAGEGYRVRLDLIAAEFDRAGVMMHLLLRYTRALVAQILQTAACNRLHSPEQQLCRWLLLSLDRLSGSEMKVTQELVADMLGAQREAVTQAALKLQDAGLIRCARTRISVLDRAGLQARTCACYEVMRKEHARLLPQLIDS